MAATSVPRLQILGAALLFSTGGAAIKACALSNWQIASFRSGIAALALLLALPASRRWWQPRTLTVGAAYAATMILYVSANKLTTAANTIFLQSAAPLYLLLLGPWLMQEKVRRKDWFFASSLAVGLVFFFLGVEPAQETAPFPVLGNALAATAGLTWALTLLGLRWLAQRDGTAGGGAEASVVAGNLITCLCCLPWAWPVVSSGMLDWALVGYLGVFQIALAYFFLTRGVRRISALEVSLLILLEPVLNTFWAWLVHGERAGPWSLAGGSLILGSTLLFTLRR